MAWGRPAEGNPLQHKFSRCTLRWHRRSHRESQRLSGICIHSYCQRCCSTKKKKNHKAVEDASYLDSNKKKAFLNV